jgi:hypothetical protein
MTLEERAAQLAQRAWNDDGCNMREPLLTALREVRIGALEEAAKACEGLFVNEEKSYSSELTTHNCALEDAARVVRTLQERDPDA